LKFQIECIDFSVRPGLFGLALVDYGDAEGRSNFALWYNGLIAISTEKYMWKLIGPGFCDFKES
jgi:hypothetical protein